jgi:hypothetical protein
MRHRSLPVAILAACIALVPVVPADASTSSCLFTYTGGTGTWTETVSYAGGTFTATENPRRAKTAPGGLFTFEFRDSSAYTAITATRLISYRTSSGQLKTVKRTTRVSRFDPVRGVALQDLRIAGTLVAQEIRFATPWRAATAYSCTYTSPAA